MFHFPLWHRSREAIALFRRSGGMVLIAYPVSSVLRMELEFWVGSCS
jgi:hypothetical protein